MSTKTHHVRNGFRSRPARRGLSFLEFVACLAALGGGVALGSVYLGIDLPTAGEKLLAESGLIDNLPVEGQTEQVEPGEAAAPSEPRPAVEQRTAFGRPLPPTPEQISAATIEFWSELKRVIQEDVAARELLTAQPADTDVYAYLSARKELHQENAEGLGEIETDAVDPRVLAFGIQVRRWHEGGVEVYQNALSIMTDAPTAEVTGPFGQNWRSAATQHRMEENLLTNRRAAIEAYMVYTYSAE
ncbi:MAG: hypothetical protein AAGB00_08980 [Planctomycetota bacterium]